MNYLNNFKSYIKKAISDSVVKPININDFEDILLEHIDMGINFILNESDTNNYNQFHGNGNYYNFNLSKGNIKILSPNKYYILIIDPSFSQKDAKENSIQNINTLEYLQKNSTYIINNSVSIVNRLKRFFDIRVNKKYPVNINSGHFNESLYQGIENTSLHILAYRIEFCL